MHRVGLPDRVALAIRRSCEIARKRRAYLARTAPDHALYAAHTDARIARQPLERLDQFLLVVSFVAFSWLAMQVVHEFGHVVGAWATGGTVKKVVLHPLVISRTDVSPNPRPLIVVWAGPVLGVVLPLAAFLIAKAAKSPGLYLFRFFAGFCLISNGAYIGGGALEGFADAGDMLRHGSVVWQLIFFGIISVAGGLYLWNGLGPRFGLGESQGRVSRSASVVSVGLLFAVIGLELLFFRPN